MASACAMTSKRDRVAGRSSCSIPTATPSSYSSPLQRATKNRAMRIVAISGSLRSGSSNAALLRAAGRVAPAGVSVVLYERLGQLPHFNPDDDREGDTPAASVRDLRRVLIDADAVLI